MFNRLRRFNQPCLRNVSGAGDTKDIDTQDIGLACLRAESYKWCVTAPVKPLGIALMICDQVITEAGTNKKSLIGVFNSVSARQFPCRHSRFCIFISITGGHGKARTQVRCVNEQMEKTIFGAEGEIAFANPNNVVEAVFEFNNVVFPSPGLHCIEVLSNDEMVLQRRFNVKQIEAKGGK